MAATLADLERIAAEPDIPIKTAGTFADLERIAALPDNTATRGSFSDLEAIANESPFIPARLPADTSEIAALPPLTWTPPTSMKPLDWRVLGEPRLTDQPPPEPGSVRDVLGGLVMNTLGSGPVQAGLQGLSALGQGLVRAGETGTGAIHDIIGALRGTSGGLGEAGAFLESERQRQHALGGFGGETAAAFIAPVEAAAKLGSVLTEPEGLATAAVMGGVSGAVMKGLTRKGLAEATAAVVKTPEPVLASLEDVTATAKAAHAEAVKDAVGILEARAFSDRIGMPGIYTPPVPALIEQEAVLVRAGLPTAGLFPPTRAELVDAAKILGRPLPEVLSEEVVTPVTARLRDLAVAEPVSVEDPGLVKPLFRQLLSRQAELEGLAPEGAAISKLLTRVVNLKEERIGDFLPAVEDAYRGLSAEGEHLLDRVLEGQKVLILPSESAEADLINAAAAKLRPVYDDVFAAAQQLGLKATVHQVDKKTGVMRTIERPLLRREDYRPHIYRPEVFETGSPLAVKFENLLVERGIAPDRIAARVKIQNAHRTLDEIKNGNLEFSRLVEDVPDEFLVNGKAAAIAYFQGVGKRLAQAEVLGSDNEAVKVLIKQLADKSSVGTQLAQRASRIVESALGTTVRDSIRDRAVASIINLETVTSMSRSFIANFTEPLQAALMTNWKSLGTAIKELATNRQELESLYLATGRITTEMGDVIREELGSAVRGGRAERFLSDLSDRMLKVYLFTGEEQQNALLAVGTMRAFARSTAEKYAANPTPKLRDLLIRKLGLDPDVVVAQGGALTPLQIRQAVIFGRNELAIGRSVMKVPEFTNSPYGRLWFIFKSFNYRNGKFLQDHVLGDARLWWKTGGKEGRIGPLLNMILAGQGAGEIVGDLRGLLGARTPADRKGGMSRIWDNYMNVFGLGFIADAVDASRFPTAMWHFAAGKPVSDAVDIALAFQKKGLPGVGTEAARRIPWIGSALTKPAPSHSLQDILGGGMP